MFGNIIQKRTAIQFLGFQIDTYIVVVLFPGSTDSHIEKMGAVLALKTITGQRIVIGNKIFHCLIPVIDKAVRISYPVLITVTKLKKVTVRQRLHIHQLQTIIISVTFIIHTLVDYFLCIILKIMCSRKVFPVGRRSIRSIIHFQSQIPSFTTELTVDLQHKGQIILRIIVKIRSRSFIQKCFVRPTLLISIIPPVTCHIAILRTKHQIGD